MTPLMGRAAFAAVCMSLAVVLLRAPQASAAPRSMEALNSFNSEDERKLYEMLEKKETNVYDQETLNLTIPIHTMIYVINPAELQNLLKLKIEQMNRQGKEKYKALQEQKNRQKRGTKLRFERSLDDQHFAEEEGETMNDGVPKPYLLHGNLQLIPL